MLLEESLRKAIHEDGLTGSALANRAFNPDSGVLSKHLGRNQAEREGLRELYSGAFMLFRNPTAHGLVGYAPAEGKAIIGLVDLLLRMVKGAEEIPPPDTFPEYLETALSKVEPALGPAATGRLRVFVGNSIKKLGLTPVSAKQWIPFRRYCLYQNPSWPAPKPHPIAVYYLVVDDTQRALVVWLEYYAKAVGFDLAALSEGLAKLGFVPHGRKQYPRVDLTRHNDQAFFDAFYNLLARTVDQIDETLRQR